MVRRGVVLALLVFALVPQAAAEVQADAPPILWATNVDHADAAGSFGPSIRRASWNGSIVTRVRAGRYRIRLHDNSRDANWRFTGPGVELRSTFDYIGVRTFTVRLRPGRYQHSRLGRENGQILPQPDGFQRRTLTVIR